MIVILASCTKTCLKGKKNSYFKIHIKIYITLKEIVSIMTFVSGSKIKKSLKYYKKQCVLILE